MNWANRITVMPDIYKLELQDMRVLRVNKLWHY
jgi:2,3-bisphosphoglycerate-dependent phosphoglycerate mutase